MWGYSDFPGSLYYEKRSPASMIEFARKPCWVYNYPRANGRELANLDEAPSNKDALILCN
jgi:hypothetical protein